MKAKISASKSLSFAAGAWVCCALNLPAQTPPTIATQLTNQTVFGGTNMSFSVTVAGTGPFSYQWQFNGTNLPNNIITTVAGTGGAGYSGDGGAATNASLDYPLRRGLGCRGQPVYCRPGNNRIRKVDANGFITTVAGNGSFGLFRGRRRGHQRQPVLSLMAWPWMPPATCILPTLQQPHPQGGHQRHHHHGGGQWHARLFRGRRRGHQRQPVLSLRAWPWMPPATCILPTTDNQRIRKVDTNGIITTVAGNGTAGLFRRRRRSHQRQPVLSLRRGRGCHRATCIIADSDNNRIRKVDTNGIITTVAGNGIAGYSRGTAARPPMPA